METKICSECKQELPKTKEYFFTKHYKQKTVNGISEYTCFRSTCKKCHSILSTKKNRNKRIKELGCTLENYKETYLKNIAHKHIKYTELKDIPKEKRGQILKFIRNGLEYKSFADYENYIKSVFDLRSIEKRKYDYGIVKRVTLDLANKKSMELLADSRLALSMGFKVKDIPKEILEVKRNIIFLKREMGLTHSSKKERNIKN